MNITKKLDGTKLTAAISGRLDTSTTPEAEAVIKDGIEKVTDIVLDCKNVDYISSSGLRLLLSLQKHMNAKGGSLTIRNINETVAEIFEVTGFSDILTVE